MVDDHINVCLYAYPMFEIAEILDVLKAAGEATRLRILALLKQGDLAVGELAQILGQSQPRLSHHLKTLTMAGLVERLPEGSWVFYRIAPTGRGRDFLDAMFAQIDLKTGDFSRDTERLSSIRKTRAEAANAYFESVAGTWDTVRSLHYPNEAIEDALLAAAGPGPFERLIDIGTGTGRMLALFADRTKRAEGIDLSHDMLTIARANLEQEGIENARVRQGDAAAIPYEDESADLVIVHQVLHYVDAPERVIAEAARILAPGGQLLVVDFAPHNLEFLRRDHAHRHLGVRHDVLENWANVGGLNLSAPRCFEPPEDLKEGLSVQIWVAHKPHLTKEAAA